MPNIQTDHDIQPTVNYKVKKRVAKKVMKDIQHQVAEIDQQIQIERKSAKILLPLLLLFAVLTVALFIFWADAMRILSGLINQ